MINYSIYPKQFIETKYNKFKVNTCFVIIYRRLFGGVYYATKYINSHYSNI